MVSAVTWKSEAKALELRDLAEKANVAGEMCRSWAAEVEAAEEAGPTWFDWFSGVQAGAQQAEARQDKLEAEAIRDQWCERRDWYKAELSRRRATDPSVADVEEEVEEELEETREETRAKVRKIEQEWAAHGGAVGAPIAAAGEAVMGFFGRVRENALGVFGLGSDQEVGERIVGVARLALAAVAIYLIYLAAGRVLGGAVAVGERSAERALTGFESIKDLPVGPL